MRGGLLGISANFSLARLHWWNKRAKYTGITTSPSHCRQKHNYQQIEMVWGVFLLVAMGVFRVHEAISVSLKCVNTLPPSLLSTIYKNSALYSLPHTKSTVMYSSYAIPTIFFLHLVHCHNVHHSDSEYLELDVRHVVFIELGKKQN